MTTWCGAGIRQIGFLHCLLRRYFVIDQTPSFQWRLDGHTSGIGRYSWQLTYRLCSCSWLHNNGTTANNGSSAAAESGNLATAMAVITPRQASATLCSQAVRPLLRQALVSG